MVCISEHNEWCVCSYRVLSSLQIVYKPIQNSVYRHGLKSMKWDMDKRRHPVRRCYTLQKLLKCLLGYIHFFSESSSDIPCLIYVRCTFDLSRSWRRDPKSIVNLLHKCICFYLILNGLKRILWSTELLVMQAQKVLCPHSAIAQHWEEVLSK